MKVSKILKYCFILSIIFLASLWSGAVILAQDMRPAPKPKQVLAIFVYRQGLPWAFYMEESMRITLAEESSFPIEFNVEHADQSRFPEKAYLSKIVDLYKYKYGDQEIDLALIFGDEAAELLLEYGEELFGDIPVVLVTTDQKKISENLSPNVVPMEWGFDFDKTGELILDVLPQTKNLFVVSGTSLTDRKLKELAIEALTALDGRLTIQHLDDLSLEDLLVKVTKLPEDSAIMFLSLFRDANGQSFVPREVMSRVSAQANVPTFGNIDLYLGHGIVGGSLLSARDQGKKYAEIAEKIVAGEPLTSFKAMEKGNRIMFDWRQLKRWAIPEDRLPAGSIIRHREPSLWADHKWEIVGVIVILFSQAFALIALIIQHRRRSRAEEESQRLRDERAHISRVLAMGEIAASLAHELNQPLSAIRSYAGAAQRFLSNDPSEPDEAVKALAGIVAGNRRAEEVIKRIRMALKKEPFKQSRLDVKDLIQEVIMLVRRKADEQHVSLRLDLTAGLPPVFGDRIQLQQVLFNLIINGIEAMADEGHGLREVVVQALRDKSDAVTISVRDNGVGIDEKQGDILFDAFYTTKPEGMGIGLSISRSIIEDHGGRLWAARNPDKGTTFSFTVPIYEEDGN